MQNRFILAIGSLLCLSPKCQDRGDLLTNNRKLPESLKQIHNSGQDNSLTGGKILLSLTLEILLWYWKNLEQQSLSCPSIKTTASPSPQSIKREERTPSRKPEPPENLRQSAAAERSAPAPFVLSHLLSAAFTVNQGRKRLWRQILLSAPLQWIRCPKNSTLAWLKEGWRGLRKTRTLREGNCYSASLTGPPLPPNILRAGTIVFPLRPLQDRGNLSRSSSQGGSWHSSWQRQINKRKEYQI